MDREQVRAALAEVYYSDGTCNWDECEHCEATLDALTDRVMMLLG